MLKVAVFSSKPYEKEALSAANQSAHELTFFTENLNESTVDMAKGFQAVCCFVTDSLNAAVLKKLYALGIQYIVLRSTGYDHVDIEKAAELGLVVVNIPRYSPFAVAEFATALLLAVMKKIILSYERGLAGNFVIDDLMGANLHGKTVGVIGTGHIGTAFIQILKGFGCNVLAYDPYKNPACIALGAEYVLLDDLLERSDIVSLHCLLNETTYHLLNADRLAKMKKGAILINTARGNVVDTNTLLKALESGKLGGFGADVYEYEQGLFFVKHDKQHPVHEEFLKLQSMPNVLITGHHAFFTDEAVTKIASITIANLTQLESGSIQNRV